MNIIYPDGTGKLDVGARALQIPKQALPSLIRSGVEFFLFEGGAFHVEHGRTVEQTLARVLGHDKPKRQRVVSTGNRAPTRVSRVLVIDPEGNQFEVDNLLGWMKDQFPDKYKSLYFAAIRTQRCAGYTVKHLGWVTKTTMGHEDFVKNTKEDYGKRRR